MNFNRQLHDELIKRLVDQGKLVEAAFPGLRLGDTPLVPASATADEIENAKLIFMAGAQHVWASLMNILDPGDEPTPQDMARMEKISGELEDWTERLKLRLWNAEGSA